jgi:DNA helicase HerA-like ATPase
MDTLSARDIRAPAPEAAGRIVAITGSEATVELAPRVPGGNSPTVGKFMAVMTAKSLMVGLITEIGEQASPGAGHGFRKVAQIDLIGEISVRGGTAAFERGVSNYPNIGDAAIMLGDAELRLIYGVPSDNHVDIGTLQQNPDIHVHIDIDLLVSRHFAIVGTTGVGKSSGVAVILQKILDSRPNLRIFLVDPHNEYGRCFSDKAQVLTPRNLRLPFWLFNFEEIVDAFFGGRPGVADEVEILGEAIPLAKAAYLQYRPGNAERMATKKRDPRDCGFTADTPVPYRIEDLIGLLDEQMGKLENRSSRMIYHRLISRIQQIRTHPRYSFMFENANIGGDTMAEILCQLFRLPPQGKPMTIMQLAGFPAEVVDSVVSVLCRMAFDFGLWSDGVAPLLFVCEEAHRYAPANDKIGFGPTRRALSRIAKEGRKYGVFLGLVTQRPAEIDPTIISQCSTLFAMRLSNDRDQALVRSAASDAAANLLSFIPSLGTREALTFGPGVALPTRMSFGELPPGRRPNSEAMGSTRSEAGVNIDRDLIPMVIERWRNATASQRNDGLDHGPTVDSQTLQRVIAQASPPTVPPLPPSHTSPPPLQPSPRAEMLRSSLLKRPLDPATLGAPQPGPPRPR